MKLVISTLPMRPLKEIALLRYPVDGNKAIEYDGEVRYPINAVLAKTLEKDEEVIILLIATTGESSFYEENEAALKTELDAINASIGAKLAFHTLEIPFLPAKKTFNRLLTDLTDKIPRPPSGGQGARVFADMTYGIKPTVLPLFCALAFAENFCDAVIEYIVYGKVEFNRETRKTEHPMIFDVTSLYYLFKLIGTIEAPDAEAASKLLKDFFAM
ncbi:hypothetical protein FACS1894161_4440 [Spirochaetia bacterium]|nr:hypothetical protein FACS1894161_4440 [Spirochaetia bacterium]